LGKPHNNNNNKKEHKKSESEGSFKNFLPAGSFENFKDKQRNKNSF
jgi:hypothetical protein